MHTAKCQLGCEASQRGFLGAGPDQRQRRIGPASLHALERTQRARDVIERLEVARREQPRPEGVAKPEGEPIAIDDVRDDARVDAVG